MKTLHFIVLSTILLSFCISQAFLTHPKSPALAVTQDIETSNTNEETLTITIPLVMEDSDDSYHAMLITGDEPFKDTYPVMLSLNSVNTSLFTKNCSTIEDVDGKCSTKKPFDCHSDSPIRTCLYNPEDIVTSASNRSKVLGYEASEWIGLTEESRLRSHLLLRVNASMDSGLSGVISLSPESKYFELLAKERKISGQEFIYTTKKSASAWMPDELAGITIGAIPEEIYENSTWFAVTNKKWQIEANYVGIDGEKGQECAGINRVAVALFNESKNILLSSSTYNLLTERLEKAGKRPDSQSMYPCDELSLKSYPVISIYTDRYKIDVTAEAYLDFKGAKKDAFNVFHCPLAVDVLTDSKSCITLGYNYFVYNQVAFSNEKRAIGLSGRDNLKRVTAVGYETTKIAGLVGLAILVLAFGVAFVRSSQKEEELRIDIDNTPRQVRSESFYEYDGSE